MSELTDILDSGLFVDEEGKPDYRTGKVRQQAKDLFLGLVKELNGGDWRKPINSDELRQKVETL